MYSLLSLLAIPASINALAVPRQASVAADVTASLDISGVASVDADVTATVALAATNGVSLGVDAGVTASADLLSGVLPTGLPVAADASASVGLDLSSGVNVEATASLDLLGLPVDATASVNLGLLAPSPTIGVDANVDVSGVASLGIDLSPTPTVGLDLLGLADLGVGLGATPAIDIALPTGGLLAGLNLDAVTGLLGGLNLPAGSLGSVTDLLSNLNLPTSALSGLDLSSLLSPSGTIDINALISALVGLGADADAAVSLLLVATGVLPPLPVPTAGLSVDALASLILDLPIDATAALDVLLNAPTAAVGVAAAVPTVVADVSALAADALALGLDASVALDLLLGQTAGLDLGAIATAVVGPISADIAATATVGALAARQTVAVDATVSADVAATVEAAVPTVSVGATASIAGIDAGLSCVVEDLHCCAQVGLLSSPVVADVLDILGLYVDIPTDVTVGVNCAAPTLSATSSLASLSASCGANLVCCTGATFEGATIATNCTTVAI